MQKPLIVLLTIGLLTSCGGSKHVTEEQTEVVELDTMMVSAIPKRKRYNPSETRKHDLLHTKLSVEFNWEKRQLNGQEELTLTPYFYETNELELDAKGMDIHKVALVKPDGMQELKFDYDSLFLNIHLDKTYTRRDTFKIFIDYTAKPEELKEGGSAAISSDKGLYFINPDGTEKDKPMQIWTQGETEASSCWFPTIDAPNERTTQEMAIKVDAKYVTLSNGIHTHSEENPDGTRTDYWVMKKPHAPYLFMMAVGDFAIIKDNWRDSIDVNYYVEKKYEPYAQQIFGKTPHMIEFFSSRLGVDYPWPKYHQIVVRDYVSGAMENTSAVIHGEFLQRTARELIDETGEDIIAHELFHHWFGDLVTCESWANLPLNESFATYGEYLWNEHEYGRDAADMHIQSDLNQYLAESQTKQEDLVRFDYRDKEEMFDGHSYQKGGRVLHMLRKYLGDDAFFTGLQKYLTDNRYSDVEMHELRLAMEEVSGEDLNWFFNQWFFASGHPKLTIKYNYIDSLKIERITVTQNQKFETTPLYKLPVDVDIYTSDGKRRERVVIDQAFQEFDFEVNEKPKLVNFDAEKMLLCVKEDEHTDEEWAYMYQHGKRYLDRYEALEVLGRKSDSLAIHTVIAALDDPFWGIQRYAIRKVRKAASKQKEVVKDKLINLAQKSDRSAIRSAAVKSLGKYFEDDDIGPLLENTIKDSSYAVMAATLGAMNRVDDDIAMKHAKQLEGEDNATITIAIASIYVEHGGAEENKFFIDNAAKMTSFSKYLLIQQYGKYLKKQDDQTIEAGLPTLKDAASGSGPWWMKIAGISALNDVHNIYINRSNRYSEELKDIKPGDEKELELREKLKQADAQKAKIQKIIDEIKENETNPNLLRFLGGGSH